jgi:hypothetical protein
MIETGTTTTLALASGDWIALAGVVVTIVLAVGAPLTVWAVKQGTIATLLSEKIETLTNKLCEYVERMDRSHQDHEQRIRELEKRHPHAPAGRTGADSGVM